MGYRDELRRFMEYSLWEPLGGAHRLRRGTQRVLRSGVLVVQGAGRDQIPLRASALTYYSILSLVPLLAIVLVVLNALGISGEITSRLVDVVAVGSPEAGHKILEIVSGVNFQALGSIGAGMLFVTTVLGIGTIERSLNAIWGVTKGRSWERRVPDYLAVVIVVPVMLGIAISVGTTLESDALVGRLLESPIFKTFYDLGLRQAPLMFLLLGFSFLYWFLPNTRVRARPALLGGVAAALLFMLTQSVYVGFSIGVSRSNAVYGGLAALPLLLVWIYVSWIIILLGAEVAFVAQNLESLSSERCGVDPGPAEREGHGLALALCLAHAFRRGRGPLETAQLAEAIGAPERSVREVLGKFEASGIISRAGEAKLDRFQLGRSERNIRIEEILQSLRGPRAGPGRVAPEVAPVEALVMELDRGIEKTLADRTLADLLDRSA